MKKTTKAANKQTAEKAVGTSAVKKAPAKKAAVKKTATRKAAVKKTAAASGASSAAAVPNAPSTTIVAHTDIGYGNTLYLRGDAPVLSWSKGVPMECDSGSKWSIAIAGVTAPFEFKVLINDNHWSAGPNCRATPGSTTKADPTF